MTATFETLLASDFSARCDRPLDRAVQIARDHGGKLTIAHVLERQGAPSGPETVERLRAELPLTAQDANLIVRSGSAPKMLAQIAAERGSDLIVTGVALVWLLTHYPNEQHSLADIIAAWFQPLLSPIGIQSELSIALLFGFVAKEIVLGALAVIVGHEGQDLANHLAQTLDWVSAYSFMLFTLIYVPCVSAIATLHKESRSWRFALFSVVWSLGLAWVISFVFYQGARLLGF